MMNYEELLNLFHREGIYMRSLDQDNYLLGNLAMAYLLQKEQKILDLEGMNNLLWTRKNIMEELKVWTSYGEYGPLAFET